MTDRISRAEIRKDAVQETVTAAASTVGSVATILTGAVSDVVKAVGGLASEVFEIREAARKAADANDGADEVSGDLPGDTDHQA